MAEKQVVYDVDGYDVITDALLTLLNQYPALDGEEIKFSTLGDNNGISMFPISGAVVESEKENIIGHVTQVCLYPFYIIYRESGLSEQNRAKVKEWLDNIGKWLEKKEITVRDKKYQLTEYPTLTGERKFLGISRQTPSYLDNTTENMTEDWAMSISARYQYEYDK